SATEVETLLRRGLRLDPAFAASYVDLADFFRVRGKGRDALEVLKQGIEKVRDRAPLEHALGLTLVRLGDKRAALAHLRRAYELAPSSIRLGFTYAVALHDSGENRAAIAVLERLHERFDGDVEVTNLLMSYRAAE